LSSGTIGMTDHCVTHADPARHNRVVDLPVEYARSGDVNIAYQVTGGGPIDLVLVSGFVSHLDNDWELASSRRLLERLGSFARLIRFDKRGTGLSDRAVGLPDLETRMDDVRAVMDAVGSERAALFGYSEGGPLAVLFAATYPQRARALVLYGTYAKRAGPDADYPWCESAEQRAAYAAAVEREWGVEADLSRMAAGADETFRRWWMARARASASPGAARDLVLMNSQADVRAALSAVQAPTLVLHRSGDLDARVEEGRYLAAHIPGARFVELPGSTHVPFWEPDDVVDEVEAFLTGVRPTPVVDRVLATVLFTDLVGSTERLRTLGDHAWAELLERHHEVVRTELARHGGEEIDTAGDGFLALFDGPARAIRCAVAIREGLERLGLQVRAGVHTGEVERPRGGEPRGIAVHMGARVAAAAGAGEVFVSAITHDLVAGSGLEFVDRGDVDLKGIGPRRLFEVV
jgi:pimeloyl-ACP methyl ester carboxylesterase/class 3 adenylate cyclase